MIHKLLSLTRPLFVLDCETTGVDPRSDRIVEVGFQMWEAAGLTKEWRSLVDPGVPIPEGATKTHKITNSMIQGCRTCGLISDDVAPDRCRCEQFKPWPTFRQLAANLAKGLSACDFAGKSVRFDLRIMAAEMARSGVEWSYAGARVVDADRLEQLGEPRSLSALYRKHLGKDPDGAHQALADVRMTTEVIAAQLQRYVKIPRDLDLLHDAQWPGWLCDGGAFKMVDGVATCQFGKWRGKPMREIPVDYYDWILRSDFPADVKALASAAKIGQFPEVK